MFNARQFAMSRDIMDSNESIRDSVDSPKNIRRLFASECAIISAKPSRARLGRCKSEPDIGCTLDYDDLCGPWSFRENPFHARQDATVKPELCVWKLLTPECIARIKRCLDDDVAMKRLIAKRLNGEGSFLNDVCKKIFVELVCTIIRFARNNGFTEEGTSTIVGIFHLTYKFFVSDPWRTVKQTHEFFYKTTMLHAVENPPKSIEIFTPEECKISVDFFVTILVRHLPLVRFVCVPNCRFVLTLPKRN